MAAADQSPMTTLREGASDTGCGANRVPADRGRRWLSLVSTLCRRLAYDGISYCHWKSTEAIERSATGENDLDLLLSREQATMFAQTMASLGFKAAMDPPERRLAGVLNFYGHDRETNQIVHVHAHFKLILGHDYSKNYHIPIEDPYLASSAQDEPFRLPAPEFEYVLFIVRMMLKHCTWDAILIKHGHFSPSERRELEYLQRRVGPGQLEHVLSAHLPWLDKELLDRCADAIRGKSPIWTRLRLGHQLQRRLAPCSRRPRAADVGMKLWRRAERIVRSRILANPSKARLASGGAVIALVGGDGAGKSTMIGELGDWLSNDFDTLVLHMGKPRWSHTTFAVRGLLKIGRLGLSPRLKPIRYSTDATAVEFPGYTWAIWEVCTARDRYLTYLKARRFAANGGISICDRYPLPEVTLMESPQVRRLAGVKHNNRFTRLLIKAEERYYPRITRPDLLLVLRLHPDLAVARKIDEDPGTVFPRSNEIWDLRWDRETAHVVETAQAKSVVASELKALVWSKL